MSAVSLGIAEVALDGPLIAPVTVTVTNNGSATMRNLSVAVAGPIGWSVYPDKVRVPAAVRPGQAVDVGFEVRVPQRRAAFTLRTFTASASYAGGDGARTATGTRVQRSGTPDANLAAAFDNVGITDESDPTKGNFDGDGNSFSAQRLAAVGLTPGATVTALGAGFTWPSAPAGSKNNVIAAGQAVQLSGRGSKLAFLGSAAGSDAAGTATAYYTDGTSATGTIGFPNWSFQDATAHGATLVASSDGRNRPDGYGNAGIAYRVFAHSIPLDPAKTVDLVVLPAHAGIHLFALALTP